MLGFRICMIVEQVLEMLQKLYWNHIRKFNWMLSTCAYLLKTKSPSPLATEWNLTGHFNHILRLGSIKKCRLLTEFFIWISFLTCQYNFSLIWTSHKSNLCFYGMFLNWSNRWIWEEISCVIFIFFVFSSERSKTHFLCWHRLEKTLMFSLSWHLIQFNLRSEADSHFSLICCPFPWRLD